MKKELFFVTEGRFFKNGEFIYTQGGFPYALWLRYLSVFSHVYVIARISEISNTLDLKFISSGPSVSFINVPYYEGPVGFLKNYKEIKNSIYNVSVLVEEKNACVICRLPGVLGGLISSALYKKGIKYACEVVGDPWDVYAPHSVKHIFRPLFRILFTLLLKQQVSRASSVLYVTEKYLQNRYPAISASFTTNASNVHISNSIIKSEVEIVAFNEPINLLSIGSLDQLYKSPDVVLKSIKILIDRGIKCRLIWIGDGRYKPDMEKLASKLSISQSVSFIGSVSHEMIFHYINKCHIYLQVSRTEGLPRALIEAMSQGIVCIGTRVGGIPELLSDEVLLSKPCEYQLSECIIRVINNLSLREKMINYNLLKVWNYSESKLKEKRESFYRNIAEL